MIRFDSISAWQLSNGKAAYDIPPRISYLQRDDFSFVVLRFSPRFHFKVSLNILDDGFKFLGPFRPPIDFEYFPNIHLFSEQVR